MKAEELKGRAVISLNDAQKVGEISKIMLDLAQGQVVGFGIKHGLFSSMQTLGAADVQSIGPDAVMIASRDVLRNAGQEDLEPGLAELDDLDAIKVVTEGGAMVGVLGGVVIDPQTLAISDYQLGGSLWQNLTGGAYTFAARPGLRFGGSLLIIPDALAPGAANSQSAANTTPTTLTDEPAAATPGTEHAVIAPQRASWIAPTPAEVASGTETAGMGRTRAMDDVPPPPPALSDSAPAPSPPPPAREGTGSGGTGSTSY